MDESDIWFGEGLRFECTRCGQCCTGAPGYVWVNEQEIADLADVTGFEVNDFRRRFVRRVGKRRSLRERSNGDCVFYRPGSGCTVYAARPRQCRSWPFWESNLESPQAWQRTCRECPGAGSGELHTVEQILAESERIRI